MTSSWAHLIEGVWGLKSVQKHRGSPAESFEHGPKNVEKTKKCSNFRVPALEMSWNSFYALSGFFENFRFFKIFFKKFLIFKNRKFCSKNPKKSKNRSIQKRGLNALKVPRTLWNAKNSFFRLFWGECAKFSAGHPRCFWAQKSKILRQVRRMSFSSFPKQTGEIGHFFGFFTSKIQKKCHNSPSLNLNDL